MSKGTLTPHPQSGSLRDWWDKSAGKRIKDPLLTFRSFVTDTDRKMRKALDVHQGS